MKDFKVILEGKQITNRRKTNNKYKGYKDKYNSKRFVIRINKTVRRRIY